MTADEVARLLHLEPLPWEGGRFRQTHKSPLRVRTSAGRDRAAGTAILYLITPEDFSGLHRVCHDEVFHFYQGTPVELVRIIDGKVDTILLGADVAGGQVPQAVVPAGVWQGLRLATQTGWALLGATVTPGYEQEDFELGERAALQAEFPALRELIARFTRA